MNAHARIWRDGTRPHISLLLETSAGWLAGLASLTPHPPLRLQARLIFLWQAEPLHLQKWRLRMREVTPYLRGKREIRTRWTEGVEGNARQRGGSKQLLGGVSLALCVEIRRGRTGVSRFMYGPRVRASLAPQRCIMWSYTLTNAKKHSLVAPCSSPPVTTLLQIELPPFCLCQRVQSAVGSAALSFASRSALARGFHGQDTAAREALSPNEPERLPSTTFSRECATGETEDSGLGAARTGLTPRQMTTRLHMGSERERQQRGDGI